jgi:hypothetical protein
VWLDEVAQGVHCTLDPSGLRSLVCLSCFHSACLLHSDFLDSFPTLDDRRPRLGSIQLKNCHQNEGQDDLFCSVVLLPSIQLPFSPFRRRSIMNHPQIAVNCPINLRLPFTRFDFPRPRIFFSFSAQYSRCLAFLCCGVSLSPFFASSLFSGHLSAAPPALPRPQKARNENTRLAGFISSDSPPFPRSPYASKKHGVRLIHPRTPKHNKTEVENSNLSRQSRSAVLEFKAPPCLPSHSTASAHLPICSLHRIFPFPFINIRLHMHDHRFITTTISCFLFLNCNLTASTYISFGSFPSPSNSAHPRSGLDPLPHSISSTDSALLYLRF